MRKVYVITSGDYSDYSINSVWDSFETACRYLAASTGHEPDEAPVEPTDNHFFEWSYTNDDGWSRGNHTIETWELGTIDDIPEFVEELQLSFCVDSNGDCNEWETTNIRMKPVPDCQIDIYDRIISKRSTTVWQVTVQGEDHERVRKVFSEQKAQLQARMDVFVNAGQVQ